MRSSPPVLDAVRAPTYEHVPWLATSAGAEVGKFAADHGLVLDPWQQRVLDVALGEVDSEGRRSAFEVGVCCPRQNGKSAILEAYMLAALFLDGGMTMYSAHEFKTAQQIWKRFEFRVRESDDLRPLVARTVSSTNEMGLELRDGSRLQFLARAGTQGRGFTANRLIFDEAMILNAAMMGAMVPTLSARRNAQIWYAGSAGMAGPESDHWRSVRDRGRSGKSRRLAWFEWSLDAAPVDLRDPEARAAANPGYPLRLTEESLDDELESLESRAETVVELVRERFGVWDTPAGREEPVIPAQAWADHYALGSTTVGPATWAVDVSPARGRACIAACSSTLDGRVQVEITAEATADGLVLDCRDGTDWVPARMAALKAAHGVATVFVYGDAAASLRTSLEALGLAVTVLSGRDMAQGCGLFYDEATKPAGRGLAHLGQPELDTALTLARQSRTETGWKWDRRKPSGDITPLVAATVALWAHLTTPSYEPNIW